MSYDRYLDGSTHNNIFFLAKQNAMLSLKLYGNDTIKFQNIILKYIINIKKTTGFVPSQSNFTALFSPQITSLQLTE